MGEVRKCPGDRAPCPEIAETGNGQFTGGSDARQTQAAFGECTAALDDARIPDLHASAVFQEGAPQMVPGVLLARSEAAVRRVRGNRTDGVRRLARLDGRTRPQAEVGEQRLPLPLLPVTAPRREHEAFGHPRVRRKGPLRCARRGNGGHEVIAAVPAQQLPGRLPARAADEGHGKDERDASAVPGHLVRHVDEVRCRSRVAVPRRTVQRLLHPGQLPRHPALALFTHAETRGGRGQECPFSPPLARGPRERRIHDRQIRASPGDLHAECPARFLGAPFAVELLHSSGEENPLPRALD